MYAIWQGLWTISFGLRCARDDDGALLLTNRQDSAFSDLCEREKIGAWNACGQDRLAGLSRGEGFSCESTGWIYRDLLDSRI